MTAVIDADLRSLTERELAGIFDQAGEGTPAWSAVLAELERRDAADRTARARGVLDSIRHEAECAVHAQFLAASEFCAGRLLSREGMAAGIGERDLWRMPERDLARFGSEEINDYFAFVSPRITVAAYVRQQAAERRAARVEALDQAEAEASDDITGGAITDDELARDDAGSLRHVEAAAEAPEAGSGRDVQRGGPAPGRAGTGQHAEHGTGRPAGPAGPPRGVTAMATAYTTFGEIEPLATEYLLAGYPKIPRGDVTLFFGDGSIGKGRMICSFIAEVVNNGGTVITVQPEDHPNEEIAPRLRAAGVSDLSKVIDLTRLPGGSRLKLSADMKHDGDVGLIRQAIEELTEAGHKVRLLVIDPLAAVVGWGSISTNAGARRLVEPLQDLAMSTGIAVCVVAHTVKSGVLQGSAGLSQALRLVYRVSKDPANPVLRVLHAEKANNLVAEDLRFTIEADDAGQVRVVWLDRAEQDRRNKSWRTAPEAEGLAAALDGIHQLGAALRDLPGHVTVTAPERQYTALYASQRPGQVLPEVIRLGTFPAGDFGERRARHACETHPAWRHSAPWRQARDGSVLARYVADDGSVVRFAVTAVAG